MTIRIKKNYQKDRESSFKNLLKEIFGDKVKDINFARKLYDCLCNIIWYNKTTNDIYSCSWRYAGGLIADLRNCGENYLDFYCNGFKGEGSYHREIYEELNKFGYQGLEYKSFQQLQKHEFTGKI